MPTYDYECRACGHRFEQLQRMSDKPLKKCPSCARRELQRLIGGGAGLIFKGSGFYSTDYRGAAYETDKKAAETPSSGCGMNAETGTCAKKGCPDKPA